jgi:hypothetical protein
MRRTAHAALGMLPLFLFELALSFLLIRLGSSAKGRLDLASFVVQR